MLHNLGGLMHAAGRYREAEPYARASVEVRERAYGPEHYELCINLNNLAALHDDRGQTTRAAALHRQAPRIFGKTLSPRHPKLVQCRASYQRLLDRH